MSTRTLPCSYFLWRRSSGQLYGPTRSGGASRGAFWAARHGRASVAYAAGSPWQCVGAVRSRGHQRAAVLDAGTVARTKMKEANAAEIRSNCRFNDPNLDKEATTNGPEAQNEGQDIRKEWSTEPIGKLRLSAETSCSSRKTRS